MPEICCFWTGKAGSSMTLYFGLSTELYSVNRKNKQIFQLDSGVDSIEFGKEDIEEAMAVISTTIANCEKAQVNFSEGISQHSLLRNRIMTKINYLFGSSSNFGIFSSSLSQFALLA
jgi:spore coat protein U-like protein